MLTRTHLTAFLVALGVTAMATPLVRWLAHRLGLYDMPSEARKMHRRPVPRIGGVAIALGFFAPLAALLFFDTRIAREWSADRLHVAGLFLGGLATLALGLRDDVRGLGARTKLAGQIAIALGMVAFGYQIHRVNVPVWGVVELPGMLGAAATVLWFVALMNALNLIDGLDGLAAGVALFAVGAMWAIAAAGREVNLLTTLFASALAGSLAGFLFYNFNPASIFMGDSGSLFLGFVLAAVSVKTQAKGTAALALSASALALGLPLLDTALSIVRRVRRKRPVFAADGEHIHHRLVRLGFTQRQAALLLYGLCLVLAVFAIAVRLESGDDVRVLLLVAALVAVLVALAHLFRFREQLVQQRAMHLMRDEVEIPDDARLRVRALCRAIRNADTVAEAWQRICEACEVLRLADADLQLYLRPGVRSGAASHRYHWQRDISRISALPRGKVTVALYGADYWYGDIEFAYHAPAIEPGDERELLLFSLGEALAELLDERLQPELRRDLVVARMRPRTSGHNDGGPAA